MDISITKLIENYINNSFNQSNKNSGSEIHKIFEEYLKHKKIPDFNLESKKVVFNQFKNFLSFFLVNNNKFLEAEKKITYTVNNKTYIGIIDALFYNEEKDIYYIVDWKISYDISYKKKNELNYILNTYAYILENHLKKKINVKMFLVLMHEIHENFIVIPIQRIDKNIIKDLFN